MPRGIEPFGPSPVEYFDAAHSCFLDGTGSPSLRAAEIARPNKTKCEIGRNVTLAGINIERVQNDRITELWHVEDVQGLMRQLDGH